MPPDQLYQAVLGSADLRTREELEYIAGPQCRATAFNAMYVGSSSNATAAYVHQQMAKLHTRMTQLGEALTTKAYVCTCSSRCLLVWVLRHSCWLLYQCADAAMLLSDGFDESPPSHEPAIRALYGAIGSAYPSLPRVSALDWPIPLDLPIDVWVSGAQWHWGKPTLALGGVVRHAILFLRAVTQTNRLSTTCTWMMRKWQHESRSGRHCLASQCGGTSGGVPRGELPGMAWQSHTTLGSSSR